MGERERRGWGGRFGSGGERVNGGGSRGERVSGGVCRIEWKIVEVGGIWWKEKEKKRKGKGKEEKRENKKWRNRKRKREREWERKRSMENPRARSVRSILNLPISKWQLTTQLNTKSEGEPTN